MNVRQTAAETEGELKQRLAKTEQDLAASVSLLVIKIKYKLSSINEEVTKMFSSSLQGNIEYQSKMSTCEGYKEKTCTKSEQC